MITNILITSSGGLWSNNLIYQIKKKSIYKPLKIHVTDINKVANGKKFADSFHQIPKPSSLKFINSIIDIVKKKSIVLIIPGSDEESVELTKSKKKLYKLGAILAGVDYKYLKFFENKLSAYKKLKHVNIKKPIWKKVSNFKQLNLVVSNFIKQEKEAVIKPVFSRGGRDVTVIRHNFKKKIITKNFGRERHISKELFFKNEYKKYFKKMPVIVMERLFDPSYDLDLLAWNGKLLKYVLRRRIGAQGINGNVVEKSKKKTQIFAQKVVKSFNLSWLYDCDLMLSKDSDLVLMELNPRISGSLYASLAAGIPLVDDLISLSKKNFNAIKNLNIKKDILVKPSMNPKKLKIKYLSKN